MVVVVGGVYAILKSPGSVPGPRALWGPGSGLRGPGSGPRLRARTLGPEPWVRPGVSGLRAGTLGPVPGLGAGVLGPGPASRDCITIAIALCSCRPWYSCRAPRGPPARQAGLELRESAAESPAPKQQFTM